MSKETSDLYVVYGIWNRGMVWLAKEIVFNTIDDANKLQEELSEETRSNTILPEHQLPKYFVSTLDDFIIEYGSTKYEEGYFDGHEACTYAHQCVSE